MASCMLWPGLGCAAVDTASMALSAALYGGTPFLGTAMGIQACPLPLPGRVIPSVAISRLLGTCMLVKPGQARHTGLMC